MKFSTKQLLDRYDKLKSDRAQWETHWQEIVDYFVPDRQDILVNTVPGTKSRAHIFDSTGIHAVETLVSALFSMLIPPQLPWLGFTTGDDELDNDDDVREFHQKLSRRILNTLNTSNFKTASQEFLLDVVTIGTGIKFIEEDEEMDVRFTTHPIGKVVVDENNRGKIDELYREFEWDARKIIEEYGEKNVNEKVREAFQKGDKKKFKIVHGIYPKELGSEEDGVNKAFISQTVLREGGHEIVVKGFRMFPAIVPRWQKKSGEVYGRSPAMSALPEVKVINQMEKTVLRGAQKTIDPPLEVPDDGVMTTPNTTPGGLNFKRAGSDPIRPILNDARIDFGFQVTDRTRARIRENFFIDQLQLQQGPQMTATEVERRVERQMQLIGPMLARLEDEFLEPMIERIVDIMKIRGILDDLEVPEIIVNRNIHPKFLSAIARAQKASELNAIGRAIELSAPFIQVDPSVMDNIDGDEAVRLIAYVQNLDQRMIRKKDEVKSIRDQRAQAAQAAQQQAQQAQSVDNAAKASQAVAQLQSARAQRAG